MSMQAPPENRPGSTCLQEIYAGDQWMTAENIARSLGFPVTGYTDVYGASSGSEAYVWVPDAAVPLIAATFDRWVAEYADNKTPGSAFVSDRFTDPYLGVPTARFARTLGFPVKWPLAGELEEFVRLADLEAIIAAARADGVSLEPIPDVATALAWLTPLAGLSKRQATALGLGTERG